LVVLLRVDSFLLGLGQLVLKHVNHIVLVLDDFLFSLGFIQRFIVLTSFEISLLKFLLKLISFKFLSGQVSLKAILNLAGLVKLGLLDIQRFLQSRSILNCPLFLDRNVVLLGGEGFILDDGLLEQRAEACALFDVGKHLRFGLVLTTHSHVPLELLNELVFLLNFNLHTSVLLLELQY